MKKNQTKEMFPAVTATGKPQVIHLQSAMQWVYFDNLMFDQMVKTGRSIDMQITHTTNNMNPVRFTVQAGQGLLTEFGEGEITIKAPKGAKFMLLVSPIPFSLHGYTAASASTVPPKERRVSLPKDLPVQLAGSIMENNQKLAESLTASLPYVRIDA